MKLADWVKILGIMAVLIAGSAFAMGQIYVSGTWRYKTTVVVETPEGIKTGSSVVEVSNTATTVKLMDFPEAGNPAKAKGEAVVVDLGKRGMLFALLKGGRWGEDYADSILYDVFPSGHGGTTPEGIKFYSSLKNAKATLTVDQYPVLVRFRDINDPKTVENVYEIGCRKDWSVCPKEDYYVKADHFEEAFGKGVKLKEITIEMTDEPVTWGIKKYLPSYEGQSFQDWYNNLPYGDTRQVHIYHFRKGAQK